MRDQSPRDDIGDAVAAEAANWHVRTTSGEMTPAEREALDRWLETAEHRRYFDEIAAIWDLMGEALSAPSKKVVPLVVPAQAGRRAGVAAFLRSRQAMAMAASLAVALLTGFEYQTNWRYDHVSGGTQRQSLVLADGSHVTMDRGTALNVDYAGGVRRVELARGAAYFDVVHDPAHPFVVRAGNGDVTVLGTAFSVERRGDGADVMVRRGRVRVRSGSDKVEVVPGQAVGYAGGSEGQVRSVDVDAALGWVDGRLVFENRPLGEVVDAIDRYYPGVIVFRDEDKAARRVNAVVDLNRIDEWLNALKRSQGVSVTRLPGVAVLS